MKKFWKPLDWIIPELELVRGIILFSLKTNPLPHKSLQDAATSVFNPPGKMIRSGLLLLTAAAELGQKSQKINLAIRHYSGEKFAEEISRKYNSTESLTEDNLDAPPYEGFLPLRFYLLAAALELLHSATLLHDDVLDGSKIRRSRPSVPSQLGNRQSILLGDYLLTTAFEMISESASVNSGKIISRVTAGICRGEMLQNATLFDLEDGASLRRYRQRISGKTAIMFSLSLYLGTREAWYFKHPPADSNADDPRNDPEQCRFIRRFGYNLGMAFQVIDDVLDLDVHADNGKEKGRDIYEGIITLPLILLLSDERLSREDLQRIWDQKENPAIWDFLSERRISDGCAEAMEFARLYVRRAEEALSRAEGCGGGDISNLKTVSDLLLKRRR